MQSLGQFLGPLPSGKLIPVCGWREEQWAKAGTMEGRGHWTCLIEETPESTLAPPTCGDTERGGRLPHRRLSPALDPAGPSSWASSVQNCKK